MDNNTPHSSSDAEAVNEAFMGMGTLDFIIIGVIALGTAWYFFLRKQKKEDEPIRTYSIQWVFCDLSALPDIGVTWKTLGHGDKFDFCWK